MSKQRLKSKIQLNKQTAEKSFLVVKGKQTADKYQQIFEIQLKILNKQLKKSFLAPKFKNSFHQKNQM